MTYVFADIGQGQWQTTIEIVGEDGSVRNSVSRYKLDGRAVQGEGDKLEAESVAVHGPAPNVLVMSLAKDKELGSVRVYAVSPDGREMTESAADVDHEGAPFVRNFQFKRIGG